MGDTGIQLYRCEHPPLGHAQSDQKVAFEMLINVNRNLYTGITGPVIELSKNGGAFAAMSDGTFAEVGMGVYTVTFDATDTNDLGYAILRVRVGTFSADTHVMVEISVDPVERRTDYVRGRVLAKGRR